MKKFLIILVIIAVFFAFFVRTTAWENTKLKLTRFWGFFTLRNNPALTIYDEDLKNVKENSRISKDLLLSGGPPKDGIPAIDEPKFVSINETKFDDNELVVGVFLNRQARAYPYGILNWHEIVNDKIGETPISVTLCPLCDTNPVFIRKVNDQETTFGVSGKLFQSCLVMYDRLTDSLWSQPWGLGVAGEKNNNLLQQVVAHKTTLGQWKKLHPETMILSDDTGYQRDYFRYPYGTYYTDDELIFPARNQDKLATTKKEIVSYVWTPDDKTPQNQFSGESFHISHKELEMIKQQEAELGNKGITVRWNDDLATAQFFDENQQELPSSTAFGFVYPAYFQ